MDSWCAKVAQIDDEERKQGHKSVNGKLGVGSTWLSQEHAINERGPELSVDMVSGQQLEERETDDVRSH